MYSEYLDEFLIWKGSAKELLLNKKLTLKLAEKYVPKEKIVNIHYGLKRELNGIFILDIWVELKNGYTSFIAVDSPVPLDFRQWEIIANILNKMYVRNKICVLNVGSEEEKEEVLEKLTSFSRIYGENIKFISIEKSLEKAKVLCNELCKPWNVILAVKVHGNYEIYVVSRIIVDETVCASVGYWIG